MANEAHNKRKTSEVKNTIAKISQSVRAKQKSIFYYFEFDKQNEKEVRKNLNFSAIRLFALNSITFFMNNVILPVYLHIMCTYVNC